MTSTVILWSCLGLLFLTAAVQTFLRKLNCLTEKDAIIKVDGEDVTIECEFHQKEESVEDVSEWASRPPVSIRI